MRSFAAFVALCLALLPVLAGASSEEKTGARESARGFEYLELKPGFVVNFGTTGRVGYLKADITLRVADAAKPAVEQHMPAIRHELIMLLSRQDEAALAAGEPRDALRLAALQAVRNLLVELADVEAGGVQDLLFTAFFTQR